MFVPALTLTLLFASAVEENAEFKQGSQAYQNLEFEQALFRFQRLAVAPGLDDSDRAKVLVWVALSYAGMGDENSAKQAITDAVNFDDSVSLPSFTPPKVKEWMADVRVEKSRANAKIPSKDPEKTESTGTDPPTTPSTPDAAGTAGGTGGSETAPPPDETKPPDEPQANPYAGSENSSTEMGEIEIPPEPSTASSGPNYVLIGSGGALILIGVVSAVAALVFTYDGLVVIPDKIAANSGNPEVVANAEFLGLVDAVAAVTFGGVAVGGILVGAGLATFGLIE